MFLSMRFLAPKIVNTLTNLRDFSNLAPFFSRYGALGACSWPSLRDYSPLLLSAFTSMGTSCIRVFTLSMCSCVGVESEEKR